MALILIGNIQLQMIVVDVKRTSKTPLSSSLTLRALLKKQLAVMGLA